MSNLRIPVFVALLFVAGSAMGSEWPHWRGPLGTGASSDAEPPVTWSETQNIRWTFDLPGEGQSTPIVWGDRIFLTAAQPIGESMSPRGSGMPGAHDNVTVSRRYAFLVLAVNRRDGSLLWQRTVHEGVPHDAWHRTGTPASQSPVTDGKRVYASFGSQGIYALTVEGESVWQVDLGDMRVKHSHGEGSSPVLHDGTLVVNWDHEGQSFLVALEAVTGRERWKVLRDEVTSWATPIVVEVGGKDQVVVPGTGRLRGYDLATGREVWSCGGLSANIAASPVAGDGMVFVGSSYDTRALLAITLDGAKGDITGTDKVAWTRTRGTPYVPSPLLFQGSLYFLRHYQGVLTRVVARTGEEPIGPFRLSAIRNVYASPVAAAGRLYVTDLEGTTVVLSHDDPSKVLAVNRLDDRFAASAAMVGGDLLLRGQKKLYCLSRPATVGASAIGVRARDGREPAHMGFRATLHPGLE